MLRLHLIDDRKLIRCVCGKYEMKKEHYISFIAAVSSDRVQLVKLYPEGDAAARFKKSDVKYIYYYCNRGGLFRLKL